MTTSQAQSAVSLSAFVVAGLYGYRKLTETTTQGTVTAAPVAHFVLGFGFVYIALSLVAQAAPDLGGMMAVLVAAGDTLANGQAIVKDLQAGLKTTAAATSAPTTGSAGTSASAAGSSSPAATVQPTTGTPFGGNR